MTLTMCYLVFVCLFIFVYSLIHSFKNISNDLLINTIYLLFINLYSYLHFIYLKIHVFIMYLYIYVFIIFTI